MTTTQRSLMNSEIYDGMDSITRHIHNELHMQTYARKMIAKARTGEASKEQNVLSIKSILINGNQRKTL